jgi:hypothetical protein
MLIRTIEVPAQPYSGCWAITPKSYLADRFQPQHEFIYWPSGAVPAGAMHIHVADRPTVSDRGKAAGSRLTRLKRRLRQPDAVDLGSAAFVDLRHEQFANWSHHLNQHVPFALKARELLGEPVTIVLPAAMKRFIVALHDFFGFAVLTTDAPVRGRLVWRDLAPGTSLRGLRAVLIAGVPLPFAAPDIDRDERLFVSRKDSRRIRNEAEIAPLLARFGYRTVYLEDHAPGEQIAMIRAARHIVAIHGAALAPLMFHPGGDRLNLIELLPVGHVTKFYRVMTDQLGGRYIAVRGRTAPAHSPGLYQLDKPFKAHSLDDFELDPLALEKALMLHHEGVPLFDETGFGPPR